MSSTLPMFPNIKPNRFKRPNPCIRLYGPGPKGTRCKSCAYLFPVAKSRTYYKCRLRPFSNGPATDHLLNWPACSCYQSHIRNKEHPIPLGPLFQDRSANRVPKSEVQP